MNIENECCNCIHAYYKNGIGYKCIINDKNNYKESCETFKPDTIVLLEKINELEETISFLKNRYNSVEQRMPFNE